MNILFSADHHIKLGQKNVPKDWQKNRYRMLWEKLHELEDEVDIHIMGGDIFDNIPNPEELSLFFEFVSDVKIPTFIYDGNHEATKKGQTFLKYLDHACNVMNKNVHIVNGIAEIEHIDIIPYTHIKNFNPKEFHNKILCTHVRGNIPPHVVEEIDLDLLAGWEVVLAGDLHSFENSQANIIYPGSPLSITFHRTEIDNGVIIFDTNSMGYEFVPLNLPQLLRKTVDSKEDIIPTTYNHTIYEVTGNILELSDVDTTSEYIDKKIVNKKTDSILNLKGKSLTGELELYLLNVLKLDKEDVIGILKVFNDYSKEFEME